MTPKTRVVAYCRVSTDHDDQLNSLENQKRHWDQYIRSKPDLELVDLYVDEGVSGTQTKNRDGFNRMMRDAERHRYDLILTKEVSRFGRNLLDVISYTRNLRELGIGVFFETQNVDTSQGNAEMWLSLLATFAQEESRMTSERVKWGHKEAMKKGVAFGADRVLGYDRHDKSLVVNEEEALIVRRIFQLCIEGESLHGIVRRLAEQGVTSGKRGGKLSHDSIRRILGNEKYCGDLIQAKTFTPNFINHEVRKNTPESWVRVSDSHPPIIDRETWQKVQVIMSARRERLSNHVGYSRTIWSGKLYCSHCGAPLRKKTLKNKDGSDRVVWLCPARHDKGSNGCSNGGYLREDLLKRVFVDVFQALISDKSRERFVSSLISVLEKRLTSGGETKERDSLERKLKQVLDQKEKLLDLYLKGSTLSRDGFDQKNMKFEEEVEQLKRKLYDLDNRRTLLADNRVRLNTLYDMIRCQAEVKEFDETLVTAFLERVDADIQGKRLSIGLAMGKREVDLRKYPNRMNRHDYSSRRLLEPGRN